jgi:ferrous iron transport protein A
MSGDGTAGSELDPGGQAARRTGTCLAELAPGARARVVGVAAPQGHGVGRRLAALGFTVGTLVEVVRRAPLGDPVIYRLKDYEVCLRRTEATLVRTEGGAA